MIPSTYSIFLVMSGASWRWSVENDEFDTVANGKAGDYFDAAKAALEAHDRLRRQEQDERL